MSKTHYRDTAKYAMEVKPNISFDGDIEKPSQNNQSLEEQIKAMQETIATLQAQLNQQK